MISGGPSLSRPQIVVLDDFWGPFLSRPLCFTADFGPLLHFSAPTRAPAPDEGGEPASFE